MFTASQLLAHLWGDYILQSDWMAQNKTKSHVAAAVHAITYSLLFLFFRPSIAAFAVILSSHFLIDRYRLARYVVWLKNWMGPLKRTKMVWVCTTHMWCGHQSPECKLGWVDWDTADREWRQRKEQFTFDYRWQLPTVPLSECPTGYPPTAPVWMATWLLIIADNILHITINGLALHYL